MDSQVSLKLRQSRVLHWLASQVTQIFFAPGLLRLIIVKQSAPSMRSLIAKKVALCCDVQGENNMSQDFNVNGVSTLALSLSKLLTSVSF